MSQPLWKYIQNTVSPKTPTTCHMSCDMYHMSCVIFILFIFSLQYGGASWWRDCYTQGLRRLVYWHTRTCPSAYKTRSLKNHDTLSGQNRRKPQKLWHMTCYCHLLDNFYQCFVILLACTQYFTGQMTCSQFWMYIS